MISDNRIQKDTKIISGDRIKPSRPRNFGPLVLDDLNQINSRVPRGNVHVNTMMYKPLEQESKLYQNKYFGNKNGLSLGSVVYSEEPKYTKEIPEKREYFTTMDPSMSNEEIKRKGYYKDSKVLPDKSIEPFKGDIQTPLKNSQMIEDRTQRLQRKIGQTEPTFPHKYFSNDKGHSLEKVRENYKNYENKRHFRDGYKKLDKHGFIRSGPFKYFENSKGLSLEKEENN